MNYRYGYQQISVKKYIDKISTLILKTSPDCKFAYKTYVQNFIDVQRTIGDIENERDEKNIRQIAQDQLFNKMGNKILKTIKDIRREENEELRKMGQMKWEKIQEDYEIRQYEWELRQQEIQRNSIRKMIENIFRDLSYMSNSSVARVNRVKKEYGDLSKAAKKDLAILKANSDGFEWDIH